MIRLLDAIQGMPPYSRFLKEHYTTKRATRVLNRAFLASNFSYIISSKIPVKYKDPCCPVISIVIGDQTIHRGLLDSGASENLLLFTVYERLRLHKLRHTKIVLL